MESWHDGQENHVLVKHAFHGSILIKITPQTSVLEVLQHSCENWNLDPEKHTLSYSVEEIRDKGKLLASCIPPNSTLQLNMSNLDTNKDESVTVSLQIDDTVFSKNFNKHENLQNVVTELSKSCLSIVENSSKISQDKPQQNAEHKRSDNSYGTEQELKSRSEKDKKLLVQLPNGSLEMDSDQLDNTRLSDLSHNGLLFISFLDELEDASPRKEPDKRKEELSENSIYYKKDLGLTESQPSVTKIKQIIASGWNKKGSDETPRIIHRTLDISELYDRYGLIYKLDDENIWSNKDLQETELYNEYSLHEIYVQIWISICFPNNLALQAVFTPSEYIQDIKDYVKQFLQNPSEEFNLYHRDVLLNDKETLFRSGLPPMAKLKLLMKQENSDEERKLIENYVKQTEKSEQINENCLEKNYLDPKYNKRIVTESAALGTAIKYKKTDSNIIIESEIFRPKYDGITQEANRKF